MSDTATILSCLRGSAWERAKAELTTISQCDVAPAGKEPRAEWEAKCARRRSLIERFIKTMEGEELWN
jgi:hypothetical protein